MTLTSRTYPVADAIAANELFQENGWTDGVAIVRAMCEPQFGLHGSTASTGGSAPFIVVNGPIRTAIGMNATHNVLANGSRANATIGRAIRLLIINALGGIPGQPDRSTLGH